MQMCVFWFRYCWHTECVPGKLKFSGQWGPVVRETCGLLVCHTFPTVLCGFTVTGIPQNYEKKDLFPLWMGWLPPPVLEVLAPSLGTRPHTASQQRGGAATSFCHPETLPASAKPVFLHEPPFAVPVVARVRGSSRPCSETEQPFNSAVLLNFH